MGDRATGGMKLLVGVDEAGYGPNLGPLVVVAATLEVPETVSHTKLWKVLRPSVSRFPPAEPDSLVIDDSKRVYAAGSGLEHLERAVFAWTALIGATPNSLRELWNSYCLTPREDIDEGPCFAGQDLDLPFASTREPLQEAAALLKAAVQEAGVGRAGLICQIVMPRRFNALVEQNSSKSDALFQVNAELLRHIWNHEGPSRVEAVFDKHGGRNFYGPLLQQEFYETVVLRGREGALASEYLIRTGTRSLQATFVPRADAQHLLVALASMTAKYLRELWMELFNGYWAKQIADLIPTAGYPVDSRRFWTVIEPTVHRLGIQRQLLWRER